jgi:hypothetical protein
MSFGRFRSKGGRMRIFDSNGDGVFDDQHAVAFISRGARS